MTQDRPIGAGHAPQGSASADPAAGVSVDLWPNVRDTKNPQRISLASLAARIAVDSAWSAAMQEIRYETDPDRRNDAKSRLPATTFSMLGAAQRGMRALNDGTAVHTGLFVYDLDHLSGFGLTPTELRSRLMPGSVEGVVMAFTSPSGDGYKIVLRVHDPPTDSDSHSQRYPILAEHLRQVLSLPAGVIDASTRDCSRLCYVSHDPSVFIDLDAAPVSEQSEQAAAALAAAGDVFTEFGAAGTGALEHMHPIEDTAYRLLEGYGSRMLFTTDLDGSEVVWIDETGAGIWSLGMHRKASAIPCAALGNWVRDIVTEQRMMDAAAGDRPSAQKGDPTAQARQIVSAAFVIAVSPELNPGNRLGVRRCAEEDLDGNSRYIGTPNGVIDMHTGEVMFGEAAADALVTKTSPHGYDGDASSVMVDKLTAHLPPEYADYLLDSLAFALRGTPMRTFVWVHGPMKSGKSALVRAMKAAFGAYVAQMQAAVLAPSPSDVSGPSAHIASVLPPTRIAFVSEAESTRIDPAKLKMYSGDDYVSWRPLYKPPRDSRPSATIWFVGNMEPRSGFGTSDPAVADRMRVVTYGQIPPEQVDPNFIGAWDTDVVACQALVAMMLRRSAALDSPPVMPETLRKELATVISRDANALSQWFQDALLVTNDDADRLSSEAVWKRACVELGSSDDKVEGLARRSFTIRLQREMRLPGQTSIKIAGRQIRGWKGLRFAHEAPVGDDPVDDEDGDLW